VLESTNRVEVGSVPIDALSTAEVVDRVASSWGSGRGGLLVTPNLDIVRLLQRPDLRDIADQADLMVCDGAPVMWAARIAGHVLPERVTGADLIWSLSEAAGRDGRSVAIVGGPPGVAGAALEVLVSKYPGLRPGGASAPRISAHPTEDEVAPLVAELQETRPDVVFVCMGFPKQERLAMALRPHLPGTWFVGCGAAAEFVTGSRRRAPRWSQRSGVEWLWRFSQEPRRLGPRYALDAVFGVWLLAASVLDRRRRRRSAACDAASVGVDAR